MPMTPEQLIAFAKANPKDPRSAKIINAFTANPRHYIPPSDAQPSGTSTVTGKPYQPPVSHSYRDPDEMDEDAKHPAPAVAAHYIGKALPTVATMAGGAAAGAAGIPAGPGAVVAGAAGAGAGTMVGRAAQIKLDQALGYPAPDLATIETAKRIAAEGGLSALLQGTMGATGLAAGSAVPKMDPGKLRDMLTWWAKTQGAISPAKALQLKGTNLEGITPEVLEELTALANGGKSTVPAAGAIADRLNARVPAGFDAQNYGANIPALAQRLQGTAPVQAQLNTDLKDAVRTALARNATKTAAPGQTQPGSVAAAAKLVRPEDLQAGFENTAAFAPTAGDTDALIASGKVKDSAAQIGAGWEAVNKGRAAVADAAAQGAQGTQDAVQAKALEGFVNANTKRGLQRDTGNALNSTAAMIGNRFRHALAEANPWSAGAAVPKVADAARALEAESMARGLPAVDPGLRDALTTPNNPAVSRAAMEMLGRWLYGKSNDADAASP